MKEGNFDTSKTQKMKVLLVEDDRTLRLLLEARLDDIGYEVDFALNGLDAWNKLQSRKVNYDAMIIDREMPEMDGVELVRNIKADPMLKLIPVIMQTGASRRKQIQECIEAGVFHYMIKPSDEELFEKVLKIAINSSLQYHYLIVGHNRFLGGFNVIDSGTFHYQTLEQAEDLACFLSHCYDEPSDALVGLMELLVNAVEHGNLGIGYEEKTELIQSGEWRNELNRRAHAPENKDKRVKVMLKNQKDGVQIRISDSGEGFKGRKYMNLEPERILDSHGRGIIRAKQMSFTELSYNTRGNIVIAYSPKSHEI
ncbi:MAG: response regulator [Rickettsiales bacterium]|nr:response regulator [Rickettsiales bacterium]